MENWGLIVLHTDAVRFSTNDGPLPLSVDASSSSSSSKEDKVREEKQQSLQLVDRRSEQYRAEKAITHELVHQWFGNLVGIWEWEELWIAEGFATYFVFDFLNAANHPHLTEHEYFLRLIELIHRQSSDGRSALVRPLRSAGQLYRVFDGIHLYTKGVMMKL
uniref:Peptidase_M1 domain-containing protein n=1 Tax=Globodera pallida TaxID=36090 RepID=A0A183CQ08_GLOPA